MTPVRRSFNVGERKVITLTHILTAALCLTTALHTSLYAPIYDFTKNPTKETQVIKEYKLAGNKSFTVSNRGNRQVYVRIGYTACEFTGYILDPGQTGKVHKAPGCMPYLVSAGDTSIEPWHVRFVEERLGDFMWSVDYDFAHAKIKYRGKWSTDPDGKTWCWDTEQVRAKSRCRGPSCPTYCPENWE